MKTAILVGDGMGDYPLEELGGRSPLQAADIPNVRRAAGAGRRMMLSTVPEGLEPGSDVANLSLLGYNPAENYTGRAAIEAAGAGLELGAEDVAFRCNLVTVVDGVMDDYSAGHISSEEGAELVASLQAELGRDGLAFFKGVQYRHLLIWEGGPDGFWIEPPHEFSGKAVADYVPQNNEIVALLEASKRIFADHPVNRRRIAAGKKPATQIWLWGQGQAMQLASYRALYGISGGVVSAVDLVRGLGLLAGLDAPKIPGATGMLDTNIEGKLKAARSILERHDFLYFHLEAPDECGHMGDARAKVEAIELYDRRVVAPLWQWLEERGEPYRMVICMDHRTPVTVRGHTREPVPMVVVEGPVPDGADTSQPFDETVNGGGSQGMAFDMIRELLLEAFKQVEKL